MSEAVDRILSKLERVRQSGQGWMARCPAHDDGTNSLKVDEGGDGRALLTCHAVCDREAIVKALGLTMPDLFERRNGGGSGLLSSPEWFEHSNTSQKKQ
jgi:hypothetical protein